MDKYLLEAMREVDAMLPGTPRISPPEPGGWIEWNGTMKQLLERGIGPNSGYSLMMANAANSHRSEMEYANAMQNAAECRRGLL